METIKIWNDKPSDAQIQQISDAIESGELVLMPTDTTYAIMGDALNPKSVESLCRLKGINPEKTNLSIVCANISMASEYAKINNAGFNILKHIAPGPVTVLFKSASTLPRAFKGRKVVGIRIPDNNVCRLVAERLTHPMITTSIEYHDEDYAINPELIAENYEGKVELMVDGGDGATNLSTVVDCTGNTPEIVRQGIISEEEIIHN